MTAARTGTRRSTANVTVRASAPSTVMSVTSVAIVGGGFGGIGAAEMLRRAGYRDATVFERAERVGGVWHHNTYPGAACDIPSHLYEFSFAPNPRWSRRFAPQAEIQAYLEQIARPLDVRTSTEVRSARFADGRWTLDTSAGPFSADVLIAACGQLSVPSVPSLPGLEAFAGPAFHTARWRHDVDLSGRRGGGDRDRLQRDPGRPRDRRRGRPRRRLPALAGLDDPEAGLRLLRRGRSARSSASRSCRGSTAPRSGPSTSSARTP